MKYSEAKKIIKVLRSKGYERFGIGPYYFKKWTADGFHHYGQQVSLEEIHFSNIAVSSLLDRFEQRAVYELNKKISSVEIEKALQHLSKAVDTSKGRGMVEHRLRIAIAELKSIKEYL